MARLNGTEVTITVTKRWFFWPAAAAIVVLGQIGVLKDPAKAGKWLAANALRLKVQ